MVGQFVNERYHELQTELGLGLVRRGSITIYTVASTAVYNTTDTAPTPDVDVVKPIIVSLPEENRVLDQKTIEQLRLLDPDFSQEGTPLCFAITAYGATYATILLWPAPSTVTDLTIEGLLSGTDLSSTDVPAFPNDFHDYLIHAGMAEYLDKMEKVGRAARQEAIATGRLKALRYFLAKSAFLHRTQGETFWWWGPFGGSFGWRL